jgi:hypothetical protein
MQFRQFLLIVSILFITDKSICQENNPLEGKVFGYASLCISYPQSEYQMVIEFGKNNQVNYFGQDFGSYTWEVLSKSIGVYEYDKNTNTIKINFNRVIIDKIPLPNRKVKFEHLEEINKTQAIAKIKYCEESGLMALEFTQINGLFTHLKEWGLRNYAGVYHSKEDGIQETLYVDFKENKFLVKYKSPSYSKPIDLIIHKSSALGEITVEFPNDKGIFYKLNFYAGEVSCIYSNGKVQRFEKEGGY